MRNIVVIGASGSIGNEFTKQFSELYPNSTINAFSRTKINITNSNIKSYIIDYRDESSIENSANIASKNEHIDIVIISNGILHDYDIFPEKSIGELSFAKFEHIFRVNIFFPSIAAKYFLPKMRKNDRSILAFLSARIGSISDNKLGGWYSYRSSKAALNMIIKNLAIETNRKQTNRIIVGLHPGTVDSDLSKPFQKNLAPEKLFTPTYSVNKLINIIDNLKFQDSGKCFAWDGKEIEP